MLNNPVNLSDPSGHVCVNGSGDDEVAMAGNCGGAPNPNYDGGLLGPEWNNSSEEEEDTEVIQGKVKTDAPPINSCALEQTCLFATPTVAGYPATVYLHPLDGNIVYQEFFYDYSYFPLELVGEFRISYAKNGTMYVDWDEIGEVTAMEIVTSFGRYFIKRELKSQLEGLGLALVGCPKCAVAYDVYSGFNNVRVANQAITIESHIQTKTIYYYNNPVTREFKQLVPVFPQPIGR